jgi:hypothetical protein
MKLIDGLLRGSLRDLTEQERVGGAVVPLRVPVITTHRTPSVRL